MSEDPTASDLRAGIARWQQKHHIDDNDPAIACVELFDLYVTALRARTPDSPPLRFEEFRSTLELLDARSKVFAKTAAGRSGNIFAGPGSGRTCPSRSETCEYSFHAGRLAEGFRFRAGHFVAGTPGGLLTHPQRCRCRTIEYLASEAYEPEVELSCAGDINALGIMFYEVLTGRPPRGSWPRLSQVKKHDVRLDELLADAIHLDPARRLTSTALFKKRLEKIRDAPPR